MGVLTFCVMRRVLRGSTWYDGKDKQKKYTKQNTFYVSMTHKGNACVMGLCRRRTACLSSRNVIVDGFLKLHSNAA